MRLTKLQHGILLGIALLIALPVAQAKKPEDDDRRGNGRWQSEQSDRADDRGRSDERDRDRGYDDRSRNEQDRRSDDKRRYDDRPRERADDRPRYSERDYERDRDRNRDNNRNRGNERERYQEGERDRGDQRYREAPRMSLSDAVRQAERRTGGQVLSAEPRDDGGRSVYRVKVLTPNGRVQVLYFDAQ